MAEDEFAAGVVAELADHSPDIVALARVASVAAIVEPALLRRLRLEVPGLTRPDGWLDAGVEADLWFSQLAQVATAGQLTLRPAIAEVLRGQLREPRHAGVAGAARKVVADAHRGHPDMLQLEERIIWSTVTDDDDDVGRALDRVRATIGLGPDRAAEVVRWFMQARRRLPSSAMAHPAGRRVLAAVAMYIDRIVPPELLAANRFPNSVGDIAPTSLPMTVVGVELAEGGVRFVASERPDVAVLDLPDTRPLVLEARWDDADAVEHSDVIVAEPGSAATLDGLAGPVVFRTLAGRRFRVHSTFARQVAVAVFGLRSGDSEYESLDPARITSLIQQAEIAVQLLDSPRDLYGKPEVLVVGPDWSIVPVFEDLAEAFVRVAERARDPAGASGALVLVGPAGDEPAAAELRDTFGRHGIKVFDSRGFSDAEVVIASAVRTVAEHQGRMYDLDLDTALTMLNSLALAFHSRYFHREEVGSEAGEQRLFDLGEDLPDGRMSVARATFVHVRRLCEWIFAGPIRSYLDGGEDPTRADPRPRQASGPDLADETGRSPGDLGWSHSGTRWPSFHSYLSWFVQQLYQYAELLRDRLGPRSLANGYAVPADALEACRLALGTAGLPAGPEQAMASSRYESDRETPTVYLVERARFPGLVSALAAPVLAAVASAAAESRASTSSLARVISGHRGTVNSVAFAELDGRTVVVTGSSDGTVRVWDLATGTPLGEPLTGHAYTVNAVAAGELDGRTVAVSGDEDGTLRVWDLATSAPVGEPMTGHEGGVRSVAFCTGPNGRLLLASGGKDRTVRVWDLATGTQAGGPFTGHAGMVNAVAAGTVDGRAVVVSGSGDGTVRVWDLATGTPIGEPLTGHDSTVNAVATGDLEGRTVVVSGSGDRTVRVWDLATGTPVGEPLTGHEGGVRSVACGTGPDGRLLLASGGEDRTVRIWQPAIEPPTTVAANRPARNVFISYSRKDERYVRQLENVLAPLQRNNLIATWTDREISPGREWRREIELALENADIILLLVSPDFLASDYVQNQELQRALERHQSGSATVVPIILKPANWQVSPLSRLQALPRDARPVSEWQNRDQAWLDVAQGLQRLISSQGSRS